MRSQSHKSLGFQINWHHPYRHENRDFPEIVTNIYKDKNNKENPLISNIEISTDPYG